MDTLSLPSSALGVAVRRLNTMSRALWALSSLETSTSKTPGKRGFYRRTTHPDLFAQCQRFEGEFSKDNLDEILKGMQQVNLCWIDAEKIKYQTSAHNPIALARWLLSETWSDPDLRYFVWRDIRRHYGLVQSSDVAHFVFRFSEVLNRLLIGRRGSAALREGNQPGVSWNIQSEILPALRACTNEDYSIPIAAMEFFLEACRAVNYIRAGDNIGWLDIRAQEIDSEYLLSQMFGIPTAIKGLDDLFGGGGIMLVEDCAASKTARIGGRAVLSMGPFGTGKSLLALQMAVEVARKGGAAWVMPMEQSAEECLYSLESMGGLPKNSTLRIATTVPKAIEVLSQNDGKTGALVLIRTVKEVFDDFAVACEENERLMSSYPLRLLVVDPINSISRDKQAAELRAKLLNLFESIKGRGTNIWLVGEETSKEDGLVEQSIADTVIRLNSENVHGYSQRYIEITKSRLQREQRGKHAFSIQAGLGLTVYPSSAAVRAKLQKRTLRKAQIPIQFGFSILDRLLGKGSLFSGDVIVFQGPAGIGKSAIAMCFLLSTDLPFGNPDARDDTQVTMLVTNEEAEFSARHQLQTIYDAFKRKFTRKPRGVHVVGIPGGYVKPGYILQAIEKEFERARLRGISVSRVVVDNLANMEFGCPFVAADRTFADTLVDLLRKHGVTSLFICRQQFWSEGAWIQQGILNNADCLVHFDVVDSKSSIHVRKSRGMHHQAEPVTFRLLDDSGSAPSPTTDQQSENPEGTLSKTAEGGTMQLGDGS